MKLVSRLHHTCLHIEYGWLLTCGWGLHLCMGRRKEPQKREEEEAKQKDGKKAGRSGLGTIKQRGKDKDKTT
jgi:hypothetical protein